MGLINSNELYRAMYHEAFEVDSDMQRWDSGNWIRFKLFENVLDSLPRIDAEPIRHGKWVDDYSDYGYFANCSLCGWQMDVHDNRGYFNFCPNCGARMDGAVNETD